MTIDLSAMAQAFQASAGNPILMMWFIFLNGGWLAVIITFVIGFKFAWKEFIDRRYINKYYTGNYVLLAIDVPKDSEQTPKAAEQMFAHFNGISKAPIFPEKWGLPFTEFFGYGFVPPSMSVELVSLGGYVQFFVRCLIVHREIIESAIYAQYPDAEITEVEDYVDLMPKPSDLPHPEWDCWSAQVELARPDAYPIRTYPMFEHGLTQKLIDPMAALLELMNRIGPDEQIWLQWVLQQEEWPSHWRKKAEKIVNKIIGRKGAAKASPFEVPLQVAKGVRESITASLIPLTHEKEKIKKDEPPSLMLHLSPGERETVTQIQIKLTKVAFKVKGRFFYWGKTVPGPNGQKPYNKARGVNGVVGALRQFAMQDSNFFTFNKYTKTSDIVFFKRDRIILRNRRNLYNYRMRSIWRGRRPIYLNVEELATIFHFPTIDVKAGQVQKTETKRAGAPSTLPFEKPLPIQRVQPKSAAPSAPAPTGLPTEATFPPKQVSQAQPSSIPANQPRTEEPQVPVNLPYVD
ncbi:hypothetical protein C4546_02850 [Candidatus Parcubacteria bacterium]|jgi:hypothetical protein|nr:MAG: hypothetical protein C4546_02850 [Candidatus Parcubacteria bacterium]